MLKTKDVNVDDDLVVTLMQLPASDASDAMYRVSRAFGASFAAIAQALEGDGFNLSSLPEAVRLLFVNLPPSEFRELRELLLKEATFVRTGETPGQGALLAKVKSTKLSNFDLLFAGRIAKIFPLLWEAMLLNFGFFDASVLDGIKERAAAAFQTYASKGSTRASKSSGPAGDSSPKDEPR